MSRIKHVKELHEKVRATNGQTLEQVKILKENLGNMKDNINDINARLVLLCDLYEQKEEEFSEEKDYRHLVADADFLRVTLDENRNLQAKILEANLSYDFYVLFDLYKSVLAYMDVIEADMTLINKFKLSDERTVDFYIAFAYNLSVLSTHKILINTIKLGRETIAKNLEVIEKKLNEN